MLPLKMALVQASLRFNGKETPSGKSIYADKDFFNYLKELLEDTQISFSCIHLTLQPIISSFTHARLMQNVTLCENVRCTVILQPVLIKISR